MYGTDYKCINPVYLIYHMRLFLGCLLLHSGPSKKKNVKRGQSSWRLRAELYRAGQSVVCQHDTAIIIMCVHLSHRAQVRDLPHGLVENLLQVLCLTGSGADAGAERGG